MTRAEAIELILTELSRAESLHPRWPTDPVHAAAILAEEAGEVLQAANDIREGGGDWDKLKTEASHAGAMALRLLINMEGTMKAHHYGSNGEHLGDEIERLKEQLKTARRDGMMEAAKIAESVAQFWVPRVPSVASVIRVTVGAIREAAEVQS